MEREEMAEKDEIRNLRDAAVDVLMSAVQRTEICMVPFKIIRDLEEAVRRLDEVLRKEK